MRGGSSAGRACFLTLLLLAGCRDLAQPDTPRLGAPPRAAGILIGPDGLALPATLVAVFDRPLIWEGRTDEEGRFVTDLPPGVYDVESQGIGPVPAWLFEDRLLGDAPVELRIEIPGSEVFVRLPEAFPLGPGEVQVEITNVDALPEIGFDTIASWRDGGELRLWIPRDDEYSIGVRSLAEGARLDYTAPARRLQPGDRLDLTVPLAPVQVQVDLGGRPIPLVEVTVAVAPSLFSAVSLRLPTQAGTVTGWGLVGSNRVEVTTEAAATFPARATLELDAAGGNVSLELGLHAVELVVPDAPENATEVDLRIRRPQDSLFLLSVPAAGQVVYLDPGSYLVEAFAGARQSAPQVLEVTGDGTFSIVLDD